MSFTEFPLTQEDLQFFSLTYKMDQLDAQELAPECKKYTQIVLDYITAIQFMTDPITTVFFDDVEKRQALGDIHNDLGSARCQILEANYHNARSEIGSAFEISKDVSKWGSTDPFVRAQCTALNRAIGSLFQNGMDKLMRMCRKNAGPPCHLFTGTEMIKYLTMTPKVLMDLDPSWLTLQENFIKAKHGVQANRTPASETEVRTKWNEHILNCVFCAKEIPHCINAAYYWHLCCTGQNCCSNKSIADLFKAKECLGIEPLTITAINLFKFGQFVKWAEDNKKHYTFKFPDEDTERYEYPILDPLFLQKFEITSDSFLS